MWFFGRRNPVATSMYRLISHHAVLFHDKQRELDGFYELVEEGEAPSAFHFLYDRIFNDDDMRQFANRSMFIEVAQTMRLDLSEYPLLIKNDVAT